MFSSSLYETPEQHAENPPSTWRVEKVAPAWGSGVMWGVLDQNDRELYAFRTRRDAKAGMADGALAKRYAEDGRWYAGEPTPGRKPYAEVQAEKAEQERQERRKIERAGISVEQVANWRKALAELETERRERSTEGADDDLTDRLDAACEALEEMLEVLTDGTRFERDSLETAEAAEMYRELGAAHGFASTVDDRINRIQYLGLDRDKSTLDVLYEMQQDEREALEPQPWRAAA